MNTRRNALWPEGYEPITPSQQAKSAGLKSLTSVSDITGVSLQTLTNWHKDKPKLFKAVVAGCVALSQYKPIKAFIKKEKEL